MLHSGVCHAIDWQAFNAPLGGDKSGFKCLFNDASDWGQSTYCVRDWINTHQAEAPIYVRSTFSGHEELRAARAGKFHELQQSVSDLPRPCWLVVSKSNYVMNALLERELDSLRVTETRAGTQVVYYLR